MIVRKVKKLQGQWALRSGDARIGLVRRRGSRFLPDRDDAVAHAVQHRRPHALGRPMRIQERVGPLEVLGEGGQLRRGRLEVAGEDVDPEGAVHRDFLVDLDLVGVERADDHAGQQALAADELEAGRVERATVRALDNVGVGQRVEHVGEVDGAAAGREARLGGQRGQEPGHARSP